MSPQHGTGRVNYLDWLRVLAVLGVFVFHAVHPFDTFDWHVKNDETTVVLSVVLGFFSSWGLAFFFLIAGAGTFLALQHRSAMQYVRERLRRLLVPLLVAYVLLSSLQYYIEERHEGANRSYLATMGEFFAQALSDPPLILGDTYHLWFVVFLLEFSLLGLPIFLWLRRPSGRRLITWLGEHCERRGAILLGIIPFAVLHVALRGAPGEDHGWGEFVYYFDFFLLGHVLMTDDRLTAAVRRNVFPALVLGLAGALALLASDVGGFLQAWWDDPRYSWMYVWIIGLLTVQSWGWIVAALGLGMRATAFRRPVPRVILEAAMPFFIVHQPVILAVAYFVVQWDVGIPSKLVAVLLASFLGSAVLAVLLSRLPVVSALFGVKRRARLEVRDAFDEPSNLYE